MKRLNASTLVITVALLITGQIINSMEVETEQTSIPVTPQKGITMVNINIPNKNRLELSETLNRLLANEYVLYTKTLKYHWNVKGKFFGQLHKFFQDQYEKLAEIIDQVAERSLQLGYPADGTLQEFINKASLEEQPGQNPADLTMIKNLLQDHETIIIQIRANIDTSAQLNDMGTNNLLCDIIEKHEKMAWMLRAHLIE